MKLSVKLLVFTIPTKITNLDLHLIRNSVFNYQYIRTVHILSKKLLADFKPLPVNIFTVALFVTTNKTFENHLAGYVIMIICERSSHSISIIDANVPKGEGSKPNLCVKMCDNCVSNDLTTQIIRHHGSIGIVLVFIL